jgi:hypothetical protein
LSHVAGGFSPSRRRRAANPLAQHGISWPLIKPLFSGRFSEKLTQFFTPLLFVKEYIV